MLAADVNVWGFDARAVGGDADERAFRSLLAERDGSRGLSGTARGCAASRAFTRVPEQVGGVARELDYLVGCASAAAAFMRGATENGCGVAGAAPWVWSDHRPVWVELDLGAVAGAASAVSSLPIESPLPGAKWDLATPAHHAALRAECVTRLAPIEAALREGGLARWEGRAEHAAAEIARVLVDVETAAIGRPRRTQEHGRPPMWWTAEVAAAAEDCEDWVAILQAATAAGGSIALDDGAVISTTHASVEAARCRRLFRDARLAALASWMQQRVRRARRERDDPRATRAVHAAVCDSIETVAPSCGVAEEHAWRVKRDGDSGLVFGDAAASSLASAIHAWHEYDPDDARWYRASARARAHALARDNGGGFFSLPI